jgi:hypothetical protein
MGLFIVSLQHHAGLAISSLAADSMPPFDSAAMEKFHFLKKEIGSIRPVQASFGQARPFNAESLDPSLARQFVISMMAAGNLQIGVGKL